MNLSQKINPGTFSPDSNFNIKDSLPSASTAKQGGILKGSRIKITFSIILSGGLLFCILSLFFNGKTGSANPKDKAKKSLVLGVSTVGPMQVRGANLEIPLPEFSKKNEADLNEITSKAFLAYDLKSGQILLEKNSNSKYPIASLTKLLTALVTYTYGNLNDYKEIGKEDIFETEPVINLKEGDKVRIGDLLGSMLVGSGNDAALALSNYVEEQTGKDFVWLLNDEAKKLGMQNSKFSNPLGFDYRDNYSTASDLSKLVSKTQNLIAFTSLGKNSDYKFTSFNKNKYFIEATNKLISSHRELEAVKTGYTQSSKGSMITKLSKDSRKIIVIVLGSDNREKDTLILTEAVQKNFSLPQADGPL